jgi:hypothetical protein
MSIRPPGPASGAADHPSGRITGDPPLVTVALIANLRRWPSQSPSCAKPSSPPRRRPPPAPRRHTCMPASPVVAAPRPGGGPAPGRTATAAKVARGDFLVPTRPSHPAAAAPGRTRPRLGQGPLPPRRVRPGRWLSSIRGEAVSLTSLEVQGLAGRRRADVRPAGTVSTGPACPAWTITRRAVQGDIPGCRRPPVFPSAAMTESEYPSVANSGIRRLPTRSAWQPYRPSG